MFKDRWQNLDNASFENFLVNLDNLRNFRNIQRTPMKSQRLVENIKS